MASEEETALRKKRTQSRSVLSRHLNTLETLVRERDAQGICDRLKQLKTCFRKLETYHYELTDLLANEGQDSALTQDQSWFDTVRNQYHKGIDEANHWLDENVGSRVYKLASVEPVGVKVDPKSSTSESSGLSSELAAILSLPHVSIPIFSGDPQSFQPFLDAFDDAIGSRVKSDSSKLTRLLQYLSGEALASVQHCRLSGVDGYAEARDILEERFGSKAIIVSSVLDKLQSGKPAIRPKDLRQFADDINFAIKQLTRLDALKEIDSSFCIRRLLERVHRQVRSRWEWHSFERHEVTGEYPGIEDFLSFIYREVRRANDPVVGYDVSKSSASSLGKTTVHSAVTQGGLNCGMCGSIHEIAKCSQYAALSPKDRFNTAKRLRLCFLCLKGGHGSKQCKSTTWLCNVPGCRYKHHKLLHFFDKQTPTAADSIVSHNSRESEPACSQSSADRVQLRRVYLPIVPVYVNGILAYALLDSGSTDTFITEALASKLSLTRSKTVVKVNTISDKATFINDRVSFELRPSERAELYQINKAFVIPNIPSCLPGRYIDCSQYPYLTGLPFDHLSVSGPVELLIGNDYPHLLRPLEVRCADTDDNMPYATKTRLGWVLQGPVEPMSSDGYVACINHASRDMIDSRVEKLWALERQDEDVRSWSAEDRQVHDLWEKSVEFQDGHYVLPIPWKQDRPDFPNNRFLAVNRLSSTVNRVQRLGMYDRYDQEMKKMLDAGYAEPVPSDKIDRADGKVWYLPHHPVLNPSKPDKVRIVFDCSATCRGVSLNSQCCSGPDLVNKLLHVLLRFRLYQHIVTADVQAMYMQVRVPMDDRDSLRFLWYDGDHVKEFRMTAHLFGGVWCASSSTFALRQILKDNEVCPLVARAVQDCMYVDDLLCSVPSQEQARRLACNIKTALAKGGFNLTKFLTNSDKTLLDIPADDCIQIQVNCPTDQVSKALGIQLVLASDEFRYETTRSFASSASVEVLTKRQLLSVVASLYDPLGLILPVIITGRMFFQRATRECESWDSPVSEQLALLWDKWAAALQSLASLRFPRCLITDDMVDGAMELHHFCDSSSQAYGACTYLRVVNSLGKVCCTLVSAKGKLAPLHSTSIPRLELCAAVLAVKSDCIVRRELKISLLKSVFWTDSQIVLAYIRSKTLRFQVFVANRVSFIWDNSDCDQWQYISTKDNPADLITRGCSPTQLSKSRWFCGPEFLSLHRSEWPLIPEPAKANMSDLEVKSSTSCVVDDMMEHPFIVLTNYYDDYRKLLRAIALMLRVVRRKAKGRLSLDAVSYAEISDAEVKLLQMVQQQEYSVELASLTSGQPLAKSSRIRALNPVLCGDLLVVGGRLKHSMLPSCGKHPIILPSCSRVARMILKCHHDDAHLGVEWTLCRVRRRFWITGARSVLKGLRRVCVKCQKLFGKPLVQQMSDLPPTRCMPGPLAFRHIGVDCFGPFIVKIGRKTAKRYGCIFTCFSTRAIHLEVLGSLETDTFINAFVRFSARRGWCSSVRSDNGTNLVGAKTELLQAFKRIDKDKVKRYAASRHIEWTFNPPFASHQGGVWERMIRTVRKVLVAILSKAPLTDEVLLTAFCEVESIVNGRPLTKCSDDPSDEEPLTPGHFLMLESNLSYDWGKFASAQEHRRRWCQVQCMVSHFWKRWLREYLITLQARQKWIYPKKNICPGELMLIADMNAPRGTWPLGLVTKVQLGRDGLVRSAVLKVKGTSLVRPVTKLIPLEC